MVRDLCGRSTVPGEHCLALTTKGFPTIALMGIMTLLCDRVDDPLHINREKTIVSHFFHQDIGVQKWVKFFVDQGNDRIC